MFRFWRDGNAALDAFTRVVDASGLETGLVNLVKMRASQVNGCAYCIDMHAKDARRAGETEQRLYALSAWRETPFFSDRERAALALSEAVTLVADHASVDNAVRIASQQFTADELTRLVYTIVEINAWNRLAITTEGREPGTYDPAHEASTHPG
jgi:AhpD family alkylhydroperoxidase